MTAEPSGGDPMRIWHQGLIEMQTVPAYAAALKGHLSAVASPATTVDVHGLIPGTYTPESSPAELAAHAYLMSLHVHQILDNVRRAEQEGYDAVAVTVLQDPGVREARTLVDIPVVGYGEAAMHLACLLGQRFAIVAFNADLVPLLEERILLSGLASRAGPTALLEVSYDDVTSAFDSPGRLIDGFRRAAGRAIAAGCDVVIPGQTIMAEVLWQNGVHRVDDAPVIDAVGATVRTCELMVALGRASGLRVSRRGYYGRRPAEELVRRARFHWARALADRTGESSREPR